MNYYAFHIGDYQSHTPHLSAMEDLAYRRMIDLYYLNERPLDERSTEVARRINMRDQLDAVESVLDEFFQLEPGVGYKNFRCEAEIEKFKSKVEAASRAGKASAERRLNKRSTVVQPTNNQEPITNTNKKENKKEKVERPESVDQQVWADFMQMRKAKQAPLTVTGWSAINREASKAGWSLDQVLTECVQRGWRGFKAEWVTSGTGAPQKTFVAPNRGAGVAIFGDIDHDQDTTPRLG